MPLLIKREAEMKESRFRAGASLSLVVTLLLSPLANASVSRPPHFLPASARVHGYSLTELATAWALWGGGSAPGENPLIAVRCEQSPIDPRIWFLPVSLGGESENTCQVPPGTFLVLLPGGVECSSLEADPYYGGDEAALRACVDADFQALNYVEVTIDGTTITSLPDDYIVTTSLMNLPPNNLISSEPGLSMTKGYFLVIPPLSRGTHMVHAYDEQAAFGFQGGITYTINVG